MVRVAVFMCVYTWRIYTARITIVLYNQYIQSLYIHCLKTYKAYMYTSEIHKIFTRVFDNCY
jgi:hypothetical protein